MLIEQTGIGPILDSISCSYKLPLNYPDTLSVGAKIAAEGDGVIVMFNYTEGKKTAIPEEIRKKVLAWSSFCPDKASDLTIGK